MTDEEARGPEGTLRRPLLKFAAGSAALATLGVGARLSLHPGDDEGGDAGDAAQGGLLLSTHAGSDISALHLPLGDDVLPPTGRGTWSSERLPTSTHSMVAFTWDLGSAAPTLSIRSRTGGAWGDWQPVPQLHDVPDEDAERARVEGTDLVWIGRADGIQIRAAGRRPEGLTLVLLHPAPRAADLLADRPLAARAEASAGDDAEAARPNLRTRGQWGANESLRDGRPSYTNTIKQVHVHHTVNANNYSRSDVPALIRGMYAYHTQTLGWSDIGYNFLVDRFGRGWVGRAGGPGRLVRGAHTLGFNENSTGISAIGNYETARPPRALLNTIAAIAAWKLDPYDRKPRGRTTVRSTGSDKFPAGRRVRLPVIDGHRDTNDTACPGQHLYAALPKVRRRAARKMRATRQDTVLVDRPAAITGTARLGEKLRADPGAYRPDDANVFYRWYRDGRAIRAAREQVYPVRPWDVGRKITCRVTLNKRGLDPVVQTPDAVGPATAEPGLSVTTRTRRRVVLVDVALTAPAKVRPVPGGKVRVRVGSRSKTVRLENGAGVARFGGHRRLRSGRHSVRVSYAGDGVFTPVSDESRVRVP